MQKTEMQIVRECTDYLDLIRYAKKLQYKNIHVPIPTRGNFKQQRNAQAMAGHADLEIYLPHMVTLHIEFKTKIGRQNAAQIQWQKDLEAVGHRYFIVRDVIELQKILEQFGVKRHFWKNCEVVEED